MKKLFTVLMSLHLILAPVAFAAEKPVVAKPGDEFRVNPDAKGKTDYFQMILGMGISVVGADAAMTCKLSFQNPSILILHAGSLIHVMSEILGGKAHNDYLRKKSADLKMVEEKLKKQGGGELQKESLESALANEKEILKFINKRKMWTQLLFAVYAAGAAMAGLEMLKVMTSPTAGCVPPLATMKAKLTAAAIGAAYSFSSGGIASGLVSGLGIFIIGPGQIAVAMLDKAPTRLAYFGVATGVQAWIMSSLSSKAKVAKDNIKKLEEALAAFKAESTPSNGIATDTQGNGNSTDQGLENKIDPLTGKPYPIQTLPTASAPTKYCTSNSNNGIDISSAACSSPMKFQSPKFDASLKVPTLASFSQGLTDVGNSLAQGNLEAAEVGAATLAAQAGRMNQIKDNILKKVNEKLKASGKKPIDLDKSIKTQLAGMSQSLSKQDPGMGAALASTGGLSLATLGSDLKGSEDLKENIQQINETANSKTTGAVSETNSAFTNSLDNLEGSNETVNQDQTAKVDAMMKTDDFEYAQDDVRKDNGDSLFKILSTRYLISYPKFFETIEPEPKKKP